VKEISGQVVNVIRHAIKLEINGRSFFNHATEVTHNELGKKMFRKLAQDETEHLDAFGKLFTALTGGEEWKKVVDPDEVKGDSYLIDELNSRMKKGERASELEAISIGMELERSAVDFFEKAARESSDPKAQEILEKICEEEKFHYELLQAQYDSVNKSGFWLDSAEFRMDGKF
jgi:rubrerythrin